MVNWITGTEKPSMIEEGRKWCQPQYTVNVLGETFTDENDIEQWRWLQIVLPVGRIKYGDIIAGIIRAKYTQDEMEAITNNMAAVNAVFMQTLVTDGILAATKYLKESIDDDNSLKFREMQEWRQMAKEVAKEVFAKAKEEGRLVDENSL